MIEKVLHVTHPFSLRVQKNMEFLGYDLKESKEVPYRRRMNVICDSSYGFKGKTIYQLTFVIEEDKYNQNKERIDDYIQTLEERYMSLPAWKFCVAIIIAASALFLYVGGLTLWVTLNGGPLGNTLFVYTIYIICLGFINEITVLVFYYIFVAATFIFLGAAIAFSIILGIRKKKYADAAFYNGQLEQKKRAVLGS